MSRSFWCEQTCIVIVIVLFCDRYWYSYYPLRERIFIVNFIFIDFLYEQAFIVIVTVIIVYVNVPL